MPEMDAMELDRYVTGMIDTEYRDMKRDVKAKRTGADASESLKNGPVTRRSASDDKSHDRDRKAREKGK